MQEKPLKAVYVLDEQAAEKIVNIAYKQAATIQEFLDYRRIDIPDKFDIGYEETEFARVCETFTRI